MPEYTLLTALAVVGVVVAERVCRSIVTMITSETSQRLSTRSRLATTFMVTLNPGYHAHLRAAADALVDWLPRPALVGAAPPVRILDLGCGSGASTCALARAAEAADLRFAVVGVDQSIPI